MQIARHSQRLHTLDVIEGMMMEYTFPDEDWHGAAPEDVGLSARALDAVERRLRDRAGGRGWRVAVVRYGYLVAEWGQGIDRAVRFSQASIDKSLISCLLGISIEEGRIAGLDARVIDYYPEMMNVGPDEGPKPGRYAFAKDEAITFRQLISQTSGYMKPDEAPGRVFHYQTFGINIVLNAVATAYGVYDSRNPDGLPGGRKLLDEKIRDPIGAGWDSVRFNFDHPPGARVSIFGNGYSIMANARDMARTGLLWLNGGRWKDRRLIPTAYLREATRTNPDVLACTPEDGWKYGYGFWVNDHGKLWPDLPRDAFAASGAGAMHVFVCPSLDLVITQTPGPWDAADKGRRQTELLNRLAGAVLRDP